MKQSVQTEQRTQEMRKYMKLRIRMLGFEDRYFKDMTFQEKRLQNKLMKVKDEKGEKWFDDEETFSLGLGHWVIAYSSRQHRAGRNSSGICRSKRKKIVIRKRQNKKEEKNVILHEMIHAYESQLPEFRKQYLLLYFYKKLSKIIGFRKLDNLVDLDSHILYLRDVRHTPLFLLKSLDLDLRLKLPFGTIYSYRREELFK